HMHLFPPLAVPFVMTGLSLIILLPVLLIEWMIVGIPSFWEMNYVYGFLYLWIFPSLIALVLYNRGVSLLSASESHVFLNFLPVVTIAAAYIRLAERVSLLQAIGAFVVIVGVL